MTNNRQNVTLFLTNGLKMRTFVLYKLFLILVGLAVYFMMPLSVSRRFILFSADLCLLPRLSRQEMFKEIILLFAFEYPIVCLYRLQLSNSFSYDL